MHGASNAALGLQLGNRIQVYWPDDDAWCAHGAMPPALSTHQREGL
jgi:hypothetical protein